MELAFAPNRTYRHLSIDFARQGGWIVVTLDADFHALLALSGATGPSVVAFGSKVNGQRGLPLYWLTC